MAKIPTEVYERAGRMAIKDAGGKRNLADYVVHYMDARIDLATACEKYVQSNILVYTSDRIVWLKKNGISYRMDPAEKFDQVVGKAVNYIVVHYMKEHKMEIVKAGYGYKLVKRD